jgi:hypothetical protein
MIAFWYIALCSLVVVVRRFRGVYCIISAMIALMMEIVLTSETSLYYNDTTRRNISEGFHLHTRRRENLKSHKGRFAFFFIAFEKTSVFQGSNEISFRS